jgi:hypothetical protein
MNKNDLLKHIADTGYNVGFGAKKHFATYDIVEKMPGFISFISMVFGIYSLAFIELSTKFLSASILVLGIIGLYVSLYDSKKGTYADKGTELTKLFNELKVLYLKVKSVSDEGLIDHQQTLSEIESRYYNSCINKQIFFSDWFAHYKFFWQHQIDWVNEQKNFSFLRDKVPLSFTLSLSLVIILTVIFGFDLAEAACSILNTAELETKI